MKHLTKLATAMALVASGTMAQEVEENEATAFNNVAENCALVNETVVNDQEIDIEQGIACAEAIGGYLIQADKAIESHIDSMSYSFQKGIYAGKRSQCRSALNTYASTGHKSNDQDPTLEERRVRATHINEVSYACLAFAHGNINGDIAERTGTVVLPQENIQTVIDTAYCAADVLGPSAWTSDYDNRTACKDSAPAFN